MSTPQPSAPAFAVSSKILAGSLMSALVVIGLALAFVLPPPEGVSLVVLAVQVAVGVVAHLVLEAVGYRTPALATSLTDEQAATEARTRWQSGMVLRFAVSELVAIASLAAAFVLTDGSVVTYLGGAVVALVLMAVHVWPGARPVGKVATALEADGTRSGLRETFGLSPLGPIQEL